MTDEKLRRARALLVHVREIATRIKVGKTALYAALAQTNSPLSAALMTFGGASRSRRRYPNADASCGGCQSDLYRPRFDNDKRSCNPRERLEVEPIQRIARQRRQALAECCVHRRASAADRRIVETARVVIKGGKRVRMRVEISRKLRRTPRDDGR
jgi:hypothetical protein